MTASRRRRNAHDSLASKDQSSSTRAHQTPEAGENYLEAMVSANVSMGTRITVFSLIGMMVGFFVQDAYLLRNKRYVEAGIDTAVERALVEKRAVVEALERRAAEAEARQRPTLR